MYKIYKITANPTVDFAAEELKKYLRMMMPRCGEIAIERNANAKNGFLLGLMADFGLDLSEAGDLDLDDIVHIDVDKDGNGIIAGSNPRSVLLAVYRYLTINGCRWLFPGIDGEFIPIKNIEAVSYHHMADCRYRGQCNEGAEFQPNMMEAIDFTPKIGMNVFMQEFENPKVYYDSYYNHKYNDKYREPEPINPDITLQWKRQCEAEITKRGLQYHDMGHGWTVDSFGIDSRDGWVRKDDSELDEETKSYLAFVEGKRGFYHGIPINTNFCMSNPKARKKVVDHVCNYADKARNVDYLHVWLSDDYNNQCECEECQKMSASDWYVTLMNEIDEELTRRELRTRIVFICYYDTIFPPEFVKLNDPKRFTLLLAAITRKYTAPHDPNSEKVGLKPFVRNKVAMPTSVDEYVEYANAWRKWCSVSVMVYEYHFWVNQYYEPTGLKFAKIIYDDIRGYHKSNMDGTIEDGSQRSFFPNGFNYYVYGSTLFDTEVDFEELKRDYYSHAYGEDYPEVIAFMEKLGELFDHKYLTGQSSIDKAMGKYYNPAMAEKFRAVKPLVEEFSPFVEAHKNMPMRAQTVSYRVLRRFLEFCVGFSDAMILKSLGLGDEAKKTFDDFFIEFGKYELEIERCYDQANIGNALKKRIFDRDKSGIPGL